MSYTWDTFQLITVALGAAFITYLFFHAWRNVIGSKWFRRHKR